VSAPLVRLDEVDSTQRVAKALAREGTPHGTCVVARRQTAGRGRLGRPWIAPAEGLFCSLVLDVRCPVARAPRVTLGAAVGMLEVMDALGVPACIKWPNDIVVPRAQLQDPGACPDGRLGPFRKVAGVLVEVARTSPRGELEVVVLGVGVNVRAPADGWPDDLASTACALTDAIEGASVDLEAVLQAVRPLVPAAVGRAVHDLAPALAVQRTRSATLGRRVEVEGVVGRAAALDDDDGALVIIDDAGASHTVRAGDVWLA
jgi:BirA family biotin operon repressor/biotin-[acetyl-CoA-carboxylase] ligase